MLSVKKLPHDTGVIGWEIGLAPRTPKLALDRRIDCEWAVIGAGFSGLAAARRLAENCPGSRIALIEAQVVGRGTSGRNTGIAIDVPYNSGSSLSDLTDRKRHVRLNRAAMVELEKLITAHNISCGWTQTGKYHAAITEKGRYEGLVAVEKELKALHEPYRWVDRGGLETEIGSSYFTAAIHTPGCAALNPVALARGLADSLPTNVSLFEESPVIEFEINDPIILRTRCGEVRARSLVLANNAYVQEFGFFRQRLLVLAIHASLTRQLSQAEQQRYGAQPWALTPVNVLGGTAMRFTDDGRFLIRENVTFAPHQNQGALNLESVAKRHAELFRSRFPQLDSVSIAHTWVGFDAMSENRTHGFGKIGPNVYAAICQNGVGITKGTICGILVADSATGRDNSLIEDMAGLGSPNQLPPRPLLDIGVRVRFAWDAWRNSVERQ